MYQALALIASTIAGGLIEYLLGLVLPEKPNVKHVFALLGAASVFIIFSIFFDEGGFSASRPDINNSTQIDASKNPLEVVIVTRGASSEQQPLIPADNNAGESNAALSATSDNNAALPDQVSVNQLDVSNYPKWLQMVALNPIIPGYGAAGIRFGDTQSKVIEVLGPPTKDFHRISLNNRSDDGYSAWWEYRSYRLVVRTSGHNGQVIGVWISDYDLNAKELIPSFDNISIGSSESEIRRMLGSPIGLHPLAACRREPRIGPLWARW